MKFLSNQEVSDLIEMNTVEQLNQQHESGFTVLHDMIERQQMDLIKKLLEKGVDTQIKTDKGHNALEMAQAFIRFFENNFSEQKIIIARYHEIAQMIENYNMKKNEGALA